MGAKYGVRRGSLASGEELRGVCLCGVCTQRMGRKLLRGDGTPPIEQSLIRKVNVVCGFWFRWLITGRASSKTCAWTRSGTRGLRVVMVIIMLYGERWNKLSSNKERWPEGK